MEIQNSKKFIQYTDDYVMFGMMFLLGNKLQVLGDSFYEEVTSKQWFALLTLKMFDEDPTINELSEAMGSSHQNVKQLVVKLQAKGFIELYIDEKDKRKTRIKNTIKYEEVFSKYREKEHEFMKALFEGIDQQALRKTVETLLRFEKNMEVISNGINRNI